MGRRSHFQVAKSRETIIVYFPGGNVEVSLTSDKGFWAHITRDREDQEFKPIDGRIDLVDKIGNPVPGLEKLDQVAVKFGRARPAG